MFKGIRKWLSVPDNKTQKIEAYESWVVRWNSWVHYVGNRAITKERVEIFPTKEGAEEFAEQLKRAEKLLRNGGANVRVKKNENYGSDSE